MDLLLMVSVRTHRAFGNVLVEFSSFNSHIWSWYWIHHSDLNPSNTLLYCSYKSFCVYLICPPSEDLVHNALPVYILTFQYCSHLKLSPPIETRNTPCIQYSTVRPFMYASHGTIRADDEDDNDNTVKLCTP